MHYRGALCFLRNTLLYVKSFKFVPPPIITGRVWVKGITMAIHHNNPTQVTSKRFNSLPTSQGILAEKNSPVDSSSQEHERPVCAPLCKKTAHSLSSSTNSRTRRMRIIQRSSVSYFNPENVQDSDFQVLDPGQCYVHPSDTSLLYPRCDTSIADTQPSSPISYLPLTPFVPLAKSASSLYQNLLYVLTHHNPLPTLPSLLDYHDLHPGLRSTRSYNVLISLALRNASYGTVEWLLAAMRTDHLTGNLETWKLKIRWLIQSGQWGRAWNEVITATKDKLPHNQQVNNIPLSIWLEFFRDSKRGIIRKRARTHSEGTEAVREYYNLADVYSARYRTLVEHHPTFTTQELDQTPPRVIYSIVMFMLRSQQYGPALSLTKTYFISLPPKIPNSWARICLDIVHLHMAIGSQHKGLRKLHETRKTLISLISLHHAVQPTSTTLFLLLAPLKKSKRCGTVAWNIFRSFTKQWGVGTEDRRVRRRVATLAAKEGRKDIVDAILRSERTSRWAHTTWKLTRHVVGEAVVSRRRHLRPAAKKLFRRNGREERHWCRFVKRIQHMKQRRIKSILQ